MIFNMVGAWTIRFFSLHYGVKGKVSVCINKRHSISRGSLQGLLKRNSSLIYIVSLWFVYMHSVTRGRLYGWSSGRRSVVFLLRQVWRGLSDALGSPFVWAWMSIAWLRETSVEAMVYYMQVSVLQGCRLELEKAGHLACPSWLIDCLIALNAFWQFSSWLIKNKQYN